MIKPKNKPELMKLLGEKNFKIILIEEGKANLFMEDIRKLQSKKITLIVLV